VAIEMSNEVFDSLVDDALAEVPEDLLSLIDNAVLLIEDEPEGDEPELLGLYEGIPLTERDSWYSGVLPDRIFIFRGPTLRMCHSYDDVVDEVATTVVHEIAHHFGIDDDRLHELGWG
jgi:predicted Zn-dependent protease with MMP-like domain